MLNEPQQISKEYDKARDWLERALPTLEHEDIFTIISSEFTQEFKTIIGKHLPEVCLSEEEYISLQEFASNRMRLASEAMSKAEMFQIMYFYKMLINTPRRDLKEVFNEIMKLLNRNDTFVSVPYAEDQRVRVDTTNYLQQIAWLVNFLSLLPRKQAEYMQSQLFNYMLKFMNKGEQDSESFDYYNKRSAVRSLPLYIAGIPIAVWLAQYSVRPRGHVNTEQLKNRIREYLQIASEFINTGKQYASGTSVNQHFRLADQYRPILTAVFNSEYFSQLWAEFDRKKDEAIFTDPNSAIYHLSEISDWILKPEEFRVMLYQNLFDRAYADSTIKQRYLVSLDKRTKAMHFEIMSVELDVPQSIRKFKDSIKSAMTARELIEIYKEIARFDSEYAGREILSGLILDIKSRFLKITISRQDLDFEETKILEEIGIALPIDREFYPTETTTESSYKVTIKINNLNLEVDPSDLSTFRILAEALDIDTENQRFYRRSLQNPDGIGGLILSVLNNYQANARVTYLDTTEKYLYSDPQVPNGCVIQAYKNELGEITLSLTPTNESIQAQSMKNTADSAVTNILNSPQNLEPLVFMQYVWDQLSSKPFLDQQDIRNLKTALIFIINYQSEFEQFLHNLITHKAHLPIWLSFTDQSTITVKSLKKFVQYLTTAYWNKNEYQAFTYVAKSFHVTNATRRGYEVLHKTAWKNDLRVNNNDVRAQIIQLRNGKQRIFSIVIDKHNHNSAR